VFYADGDPVPPCSPVKSEICLKPIETLEGGDLRVTFEVTSDIRLRG
jgi:hypothetical protein